jgi:hypothetical protein
MYKINSKKFILFFIFFSFLSLSNIYISILEPIYTYTEDRIYNLREIPEKYRVSLLEHFIDERYVKDSILIIGDSQPNGNGHITKKYFLHSYQVKLIREL